MPRREDIRRILVIGSGPIVIGQATEFDYSGTQACKALMEEGYEVVLVNSNPATIMTDPEFSHRTYVEPLTPGTLEMIIEREQPDALLPTVGGQTALNLASGLAESGFLDERGVELIGAKLGAIQVAEDRKMFKEAMEQVGLECPKSEHVHTVEEALAFTGQIGYPVIVRPSFTLGGAGGGIAYNVEELRALAEKGIDASPVGRILVEESVIGWKEYEMELMRDLNDNVVVICSIENFDAMGVHTGDSITTAPAQTLTDREYQRMRDMSIKVIRTVGVETGGSNIQFALHPEDGRMLVIEMNPRVSRSSALASKATGFPIAKIAAKLAVGYTLDEIPNDITRRTPASFEPTIDYCVVKIPRWAFEKFPYVDQTLTTQMKSVGEAMAMGRTFREALGKCIRSLEIGRAGLADGRAGLDPDRLREKLRVPNWERLYYIHLAFQSGMDLSDVSQLTGIDPWFLRQVEQLVEIEGRIRAFPIERLPRELLYKAKRMGFSDGEIAALTRSGEPEVRARRLDEGLRPVYKRVDTCGAEFEAFTPYFYSTYEEEDECRPTDRRKIMILGGGPNRIGQGIEFDYCCCHAAFALKEEGFETIMVNCNPETVSTDYDTSDRLYFEPLTLEDILDIAEAERPEGVIVHYGGQTPLSLALDLQAAGVPIIGTSPEHIDLAEDRRRFGALLEGLGIPRPADGTATDLEQALEIARRVGYPVLVRPSYVLGGRAMAVVYEDRDLEEYMATAVKASPSRPVLIDRFLEGATEVDVDAVCDGEEVVVAGVMEHIEEAGIHSGDSACVLPPWKLSTETVERIKEYTVRLARALEVKGLINVQYAVQEGEVCVLEVNPRASRTIPFVSKATGVPWAGIGAKVMAGRSLEDLEVGEAVPAGSFVKAVVFPFTKFPGTDTILGPEMRSTGEVMGSSPKPGRAIAKAFAAAGNELPEKGRIFLSVSDPDKPAARIIAGALADLGFEILATEGTGRYLEEAGIPVSHVYKVGEGPRPHVVDRIKNHEVDLIINTPRGRGPYMDDRVIRTEAIAHSIPCITTMEGASAAVDGIRSIRKGTLQVKTLQEYHSAGAPAAGDLARETP
ncbi:MAG: carbamoyl-phosphate synthase large subunit [bacterium]